VNFFDLNRQDLSLFLLEQGVSQAHLARLFSHVYRQQHFDPKNTPYLPKAFVKKLRPSFCGLPGKILKARVSRYDSSVKLVIGWADASSVECVIMPESRRITLCLSSQVGCKRACSFCHTGRMGLVRQLSPSEIVAQYAIATTWLQNNTDWFGQVRLPVDSKISNVVFMGMGEPLDNIDAVSKAIDIFTDPFGVCLSARKISVSTAGHVTGLRTIAKRFPTLSIAVSLHATTDSSRSKIMPINREWPLSELIEAIEEIAQTRRQGVLIQYTVIQGVNDSKEHAQQLANLLAGINVKLNLIPLNEIEPSRFRSPNRESLEAFRDTLHQSGLRVMIRYSKGQDIAAACGQLVKQ